VNRFRTAVSIIDGHDPPHRFHSHTHRRPRNRETGR
jgi:hypothetical protein